MTSTDTVDVSGITYEIDGLANCPAGGSSGLLHDGTYKGVAEFKNATVD